MAEWLREVSVGTWYEASHELFEIIGIDAKAEVVLVQYYDGVLDEMDFDSWTQLEARPTAPPEDLTGAIDAERVDFGLDEPSAESERCSDAEGWLTSHNL